MQTIGAFEAKTNLSKLLDRVERGESVLITRNGAPVAELIPVSRPQDRQRIREAIDALRELRKGNMLGGLRARDLIEEGRR